MKLTDSDLQEIIGLLDDSDYGELEVETANFRLVLKRESGGEGGWSAQRETRSAPRVIAPSGNAKAPATGDRPAAVAADLAPGTAAIEAPMVGTFYRAPRPGADPFVEPGSRVEADTVVAIIEVMKLMYSVTAGVRGEVIEVHVENGTLVQKGERLMLVREGPA